MGEGSFGKVVRCKNLNTDEIRAIKVLKLNTTAGKAEEKALKAIRQLDADKANLIKFYEGFSYKGHKCLVFEFLSESLFDFFVNRKLLPLHVSEIRIIAQQLLTALDALKSIGIVHCDIKPDNIMLVNHESQPFKVKLIDFGNAMKTSTLEKVQMIQALGYRAPEVVLGLPLNEAVDMWALGCVLAYVFIGRHIYPLQSEYEFIRVLTELQGFPDNEVLSRGSKVETFFTFTEDLCWKLKTKKEYKEITGTKVVEYNCVDKYVNNFDELSKLHPGLDDPAEETDTKAFMSILKRMLNVNPAKRITPREGLGHRFINMAHLSSKSEGPYVTLAHANMRESQLEDAAVQRFETSSETVGINSSSTASSDHQLEDDTEHEENQTDVTSQKEMFKGIERSCKSMAALQEYGKLSCKKGRILICVRPQRSTEETSSTVTKQIQPVRPKTCSTTKPPNPTRCEAMVTAKVSKASPKVIKVEPAPDKRAIKSSTADKNASCSAENRFDIVEGKSNQTCLERMQNFFTQMCECCRRNK